MKRTPLNDCYDYCERLTKRTAGNFYFSFRGLPSKQYRAMCALYALMRVTDDIGDGSERDPSQQLNDLQVWRQRLTNVLAPDWSDSCAVDWTESASHVLPAVRDMVLQFAIPPKYLFAVIDGVESDIAWANREGAEHVAAPCCRFVTFAELSSYCYQVAGAVGLCCIHIWGFHGEPAIARAIDCGTAFQLTNILRDVGEDAQVGRVYLPADDLRQFGVMTDGLLTQRYDDPFRALMAFESERAKSFYASAEMLLPLLHPHGQPIFKAMLQLYGGLLREIERRGFNVFREHVSLPKWRKMWIAADALIHQKLFAR